MDKKVVVAILLIAALAIGYFFAWPKLQPYFAPAPPPPTGNSGDPALPI